MATSEEQSPNGKQDANRSCSRFLPTAMKPTNANLFSANAPMPAMPSTQQMQTYRPPTTLSNEPMPHTSLMNGYDRASFAPLRETLYGIAFHWTTWTVDHDGKSRPFEQMVEAFDVRAFVAQAAEAGAGHVMITVTHALHHLPCPSAEVDRILPGRTCARDLIMEIADGLHAAGIRLMLYYNHGTSKPPSHANEPQDPRWQQAVGSFEKTERARYYDNYCRVVSELCERYGPKVIAMWFDSGNEHAQYADTPWHRFTAAAKAGHPDRLVTYNSGVLNHECHTPYQDYWAGEINGLVRAARGPLTPHGLPWYALCTWHGYDRYCQRGEWGLSEESFGLDWPAPEVESVVRFVRWFEASGGAVTFNLFCYADGSALESDLAVLREAGRLLRQGT